jgi:hypothetical protein
MSWMYFTDPNTDKPSVSLTHGSYFQVRFLSQLGYFRLWGKSIVLDHLLKCSGVAGLSILEDA